MRRELSIVENCLHIKEKHGKNTAFYFPISASQNSADQLKATEMIEKYLIEKGEKQLCFCYVNDELLGEILHLYKNNIKLKNSRRWRDYLYLNESFFEYKGKKLSGQKSHVKAFKKEYPDYEVKEFKSGDEKKLLGFLDEFAQKFSNDGSKYAKIELKRTKKIIDKIATLNLLCVYIQVKQKVVALSIGEKIGDTLICHVEKALRGYSGAYPMMASEFSKMYKDATFLNREDDAGDLGLRTSQTQYKPLNVLNNHAVLLNSKFAQCKKITTIKRERVGMKKINK